jgi:RimJ/RimL family protein N-acetyltransferase
VWLPVSDPRGLPWPPAPIRTERLLLRAAQSRDRAAVIELNASPEVAAYLGGPTPREELERTVPAVPGQRAGFFAVERDGELIGTVELNAHAPAPPNGHRAEAAGTALGYLFLPHAWGRGYATEACTAALGWFSRARPGEPVALYTRTANVRSMRLAAKLGFTERERFVGWDAEQWFGVWSPARTREATPRIG